MKDYFSKTLVSYGVVNTAEADEYVDYLMGDFKALIAGTKDKKASNFIDMSVNEFTVKKIDDSSLANPEILRSQIVDYMKYRAPVNFGMSFLDSVKAFKNVETQTEVTKAQVEAQQSTQDVNQACATAMKLIREHDKLIDSINTDSGAEAVKGKVSKSDGNLVKIKEYDPGAKVIMVTAAGQKGKMVDAIKLGAAEFVTKPFETDQIISIIESIEE